MSSDQRTSPNTYLPPLEAVALRLRRSLGEGLPLDGGIRARLERAFGADLSQVSIHTDGEADQLALMLGADAFTTGADIFFRDGAYNPDTLSGIRLIAHEAAHTLQQAGDRGARLTHSVRLSHPGDFDERAADREAERLVEGEVIAAPKSRLAARPLLSSETVVIQRHSSWEHRLLGDAPADDLNSIAQDANPSHRRQLLEALRDYLKMWEHNPDVKAKEINARYPDIRTLTLKASGLVVTYGELNTLPDYLPDAPSMDELPGNIVRPILQAVRQEGFYNVSRLLGTDVGNIKFEGAIATHLSNGTINDIWESIWLDDLTANLPPPGSARHGTNSYAGLLARNACHFAPYSWYRWGQSYDLALRKAQEYHATGNADTMHEAWIHHGYADHFLQDSFAAGHLINKTLVMQWFVDWASSKRFEKVPDWEQVKAVTAARQPGISARGLYTPGNPGGVRDPQTAEEQESVGARMDMSGVLKDGDMNQVAAYQNYLTFLNNAVIQSSPLALHDDINESGLFVASQDQRTPYQLFGDGTMLNGGDGVRIASETAHMSQQSIQDVLHSGTTRITKDRIQNRFPTMARTESGEVLPLEQWNEQTKDRAHKAFEGVHDIVIGTVKPHMGKVSIDQVSTFRIKLAYHGLEGYLGRQSDEWARLVDKDAALKLKMRFDNGLYYGTEDNWWLSVGTALSRRGYVGFYWWNNTGKGTWEYDKEKKRLKSGVNGAEMSIHGGDGYIYCWSGYEAADVELEEVEDA